ncbi:MAG: sulfurtransferase [Candidatus Heimdallarchaeaceae archaeon]
MNQQCYLTFVTTDYLASLLNHKNLKILDLREYNKFESSHIPGSVYVDNSIFSSVNIEGYNEIPKREIVENALRQAGINSNDMIFLIDDVFNLNCSLAMWTLHYYGIKNAFLLDGALAKWQKEKRAMTKENTSTQKGNIKLKEENPSIFISKDEIMLNIYSDDFIFVDNRSEFALTMDQQGGSIPGAVHYWWMDMFVEHPDYFLLKPKNIILKELESLGITKNKTIVNFCETAPQSALVYLVMKDLGFPKVKLYLAGYNEWRLCGGFV